MADYTTHDEGVGGRGLLVAVVLIGGFILGIAFLGSNGADINGAPPAAIDPAPATANQ